MWHRWTLPKSRSVNVVTMLAYQSTQSLKDGSEVKGYDFTSDREIGFDLSGLSESSSFVLVCGADDVPRLRKDNFDWDESTVLPSTNLDETMRYTSYNGYDFVSMLHLDVENDQVYQSEINIYVAQRYLVLVLPEHPGDIIKKLSDRFMAAIETARTRKSPLAYLYHCIFDWMATGFSNTLEELEDKMEDISEAIERMADKNQRTEIGALRKKAYTCKKLLRALSFMGEQILIDENKLLNRETLRYFRSIDTRLVRLYGCADNLFELSQELLRDYESKISSQMNENVKKLTQLTVFFSPLTVIAGIYGMNFKYMPELGWPYGYPLALGLMLLANTVIYLVLKKKKWF